MSVSTAMSFDPTTTTLACHGEVCPRDLEVIQDVDEEDCEDLESVCAISSSSTSSSIPSQPIPTNNNSNNNNRRFSRRFSYHQYQYHSNSTTPPYCPSTPALSSSPPSTTGFFSCSSSVTSSPGGTGGGGHHHHYQSGSSSTMSPNLVGIQCQFCYGLGGGAVGGGGGIWTSDMRQYIMTDIGPQPSNSQVPTLRSQSHLVRQRSSSKMSPAAAVPVLGATTTTTTIPAATMMMATSGGGGVATCPECGGCGVVPTTAANANGTITMDGVVPNSNGMVFGGGGGGHGSMYSRWSSVTDLCTIPQDEILPPMKVPFERRRFVGHDEWDDDE